MRDDITELGMSGEIRQDRLNTKPVSNDTHPAAETKLFISNYRSLTRENPEKFPSALGVMLRANLNSQSRDDPTANPNILLVNHAQ